MGQVACCENQKQDPYADIASTALQDATPSPRELRRYGSTPINDNKKQLANKSTGKVFFSHNWGRDGEMRDNHARVRQIHESLRQRGLQTWFDEAQMEGDILMAMTEGIDECDIVCVCVTRTYIKKIQKEGQDNCKLEFNYAYQRKGPQRMIPLVMETACADPSTWDGPVGAILASKLYISFANSSFDTNSTSPAIEALCHEIQSTRKSAPAKHGSNTLHTHSFSNRQKSIERSNLIALLEPLPFSARIKDLNGSFCTGTREWIFEGVRKFMAKSRPASTVYVIAAPKGVGKSGISAKLTQEDFVAAHFFFAHNDSRKRDPRRLFTTMAMQLSLKLPQYHRALLDAMQQHHWSAESMRAEGVHELFDMLFSEILQNIDPPDTPLALLIDALDECENQGRIELLKIFRTKVKQLPKWLRIIVLTRPSSGSGMAEDILAQLRRFELVELSPHSPENQRDVELYALSLLCEQQQPEAEALKQAVTTLVEKSGGLFVYLEFVRERIKTTTDLGELPDGLTDLYQDEFDDRVGNLESDEDMEVMHKCLCAIVAVQEPVPIAALPAILKCTEETARRVVGRLALFFPIVDDRLQIYHRSVSDWLTDPDRRGEDFWIDMHDGHTLLAESCCMTIQREVLRQLATRRALASDNRRQSSFHVWELYSLRYVVHHLIITVGVDKLRHVVCDLRYVESKAQAGQAFTLVKDYASMQRLASKPVTKVRRESNWDLLRRAASSPEGLKQADGESVEAIRTGTPSSPKPSQGVRFALPGPDSRKRVDSGGSEIQNSELDGSGSALNPGEFPGTFEGAKTVAGHFLRFAMQFGATLAQRPHLTLQCAANWAKEMVPYTQAHVLLKSAMIKGYRWLKCLGYAYELPDVLLSMKHDNDCVFSVGVSTDDTKVASGGADGAIRIFDLQSGEQLLRVDHGSGKVNSVTFSSTDSMLASGGKDGFVRIFDVSSGMPLMVMQCGTDQVNSAFFSSDDTHLVAGGSDGHIRVFEVGSGSQLVTIKHGAGQRVYSACYSPDDTKIASGGKDGYVRVFDAASGEELMSMQHGGAVDSSGPIFDVDFSADGTKIASSSDDGTSAVWSAVIDDGPAGKLLCQTKNTQFSARSVCFALGDTRLISGGYGGLQLFDASTGRRLTHVEHGAGCMVFDANSTSDGSHFVSGGNDGSVKVFDQRLNQEESEAEEVVSSPRSKVSNSSESLMSNRIMSVSFSPDSQSVVSSTVNGHISIHQATAGISLLRVTCGDPTAHNSYNASIRVDCVQYLHDDKLAAACQDGFVRIFDAQTGDMVQKMKHGGGAVKMLDCCKGRLASCGDNGIVRVFEIATGKVLTCVAHAEDGERKDWLWAVGFSSDASMVVAVSDEVIKVYQVPTGALLKRSSATEGKFCMAGAGRFRCAFFALNDTRLVVCGLSGHLVVFNLSGEVVLCIENKFGVRTAHSTADFSKIAYGSVDGNISVCETTHGEKLFVVSVGVKVNGLKFSPDGSKIVTGAEDGSVRVLDVSGNKIICLFAGDGAVEGMRFSIRSEDIFLSVRGDGAGTIANDSAGISKRRQSLAPVHLHPIWSGETPTQASRRPGSLRWRLEIDETDSSAVRLLSIAQPSSRSAGQVRRGKAAGPAVREELGFVNCEAKVEGVGFDANGNAVVVLACGRLMQFEVCERAKMKPATFANAADITRRTTGEATEEATHGQDGSADGGNPALRLRLTTHDAVGSNSTDAGGGEVVRGGGFGSSFGFARARKNGTFIAHSGAGRCKDSTLSLPVHSLPVELPSPSQKYHYFLSHLRETGANQVYDLSLELEKRVRVNSVFPRTISI
jgi:WD40 repeat protein